jgi:multicomponent Na+:H+ antiporter subunit D
VVVTPIVGPLLGAAVCLMVPTRRTLQHAIAIASLAVSLAAAVALVLEVRTAGSVAVVMGGWSPAVGIGLVADRFGALVLVVAVAVMLAVKVYAAGQQAPDQRSPFYHPAYLGLAAGVAGAFLAADLFNLFVWFEVLLMASYVLLTLEGNDAQIQSGITYVVLNVIESTVLLAAVGLVYATTGTVAFSELPERLATLPEGTRALLNLLLLLAFGLKAAVFPLFFWLPDSYPTAASPITAIFAGLLTKIGVFAMIRTETILFPGGQQTLLLVVASLTMVVGGIGAIAHKEMKRILSFHIVSQIGYMVLGLAIGTPAALAATVFFLVNQIPVKTALFLVEGIVEGETGTSDVDRVSGLVRVSGALGVLFLLPALSLSGLPPFSGFVAKLGIVRSGLDDGQGFFVAVGLAASILTLVSMTKIWVGGFWGDPEPDSLRPGILARRPAMAAATISVVVGTVAVAVFAGPLYDFSLRAAETLLDPAAFVAEGG